MAVRLVEPCPHCDNWLSVVFKREMSGGPLLCALQHGDWPPGEWREVRGFEDLSRLSAVETAVETEPVVTSEHRFLSENGGDERIRTAE